MAVATLLECIVDWRGTERRFHVLLPGALIALFVSHHTPASSAMCIDIEPSQTTLIEGKGPGRARHLMNVLWDQTVLTYIKVSENHHQLEEHGKYSFAMCRAELISDNLLPVSVLAEVPRVCPSNKLQ